MPIHTDRFSLMIKTTLIFTFVILLGLVPTAEAKIHYKKAIEQGKQYCGALYPATKKYAKARKNILKGGCWSCPAGFKRTVNPAPDKHKSCKKKRPWKDAKYVSKATGMLKNVCKGKPWLKDKRCWVCPKGFKRSLKIKNGKAQCKPKTKHFYHAATKRGVPGCGKGNWSPLASGSCFSCPAGYMRNTLRVSSNRAKDSKACMTFKKSKKGQAKFISKHVKRAKRELNKHPDLIAQAGKFQTKIAKVISKKGIKNMTKADFRKAGGVKLLHNASCGKQYGSMTLTVGGDAAFVVGGNGSGGFAIGLVDECEAGEDGNDWIDQDTDFRMMWLATVNVSGGASFGTDGSVNIGFWNARYDELHGFAQGIVGGGSVSAVGVNGSAWWAINWAGKKDKFVGISLGYQGGLSGELEYNWGYTFQKGTFNKCKNVTVQVMNKTGKQIKVIDVDYHDYNKDIWRSEPTKNRKIGKGKTYTNRFNLEQVGNAHTQIRVKYRIKKGMGWSKVKKSWSNKGFCEDDKTYRVELKNKT